LRIVGFRGVIGDGHAKMEAWMKVLLNQSLITPVAMVDNSLYFLIQYLFTYPSGLVIVFGYPPRYNIQHKGVCQNGGGVIVRKMMYLMQSSGFDLVSDAYFQRLFQPYRDITFITSDFEYVEGMNPWLAEAYTQYDVGQEHAIVITCSRDNEGLVICDSRLPRHLVTIHGVCHFGFEIDSELFACLYPSDSDNEN
jgi:hypothetical protein